MLNFYNLVVIDLEQAFVFLCRILVSLYQLLADVMWQHHLQVQKVLFAQESIRSSGE